MLHHAVLPRVAVLGPGTTPGILEVRSPLTGTITRVVVIAGTANSSGAAIFDVNVNGTTIFTDQATRPNLEANATSEFVTGLTAEIQEGDLLTVDADTIPTGGFPAKSLTVLITIDDSLTLPTFTADALTPRQVYAFDPISGALAPADAVLTHDAVIFDLYFGALARVPTTLELSTARTNLLAGMNAGAAALLAALRTLGHALFTSAEYVARARSNSQFVHDLYFAYLGRDSDGAGQSAWEAVLTGGATRSTVDTDFSAGTELSNLRFPRIAGAGSSPRAANPMTTAGDIIVGGASGAETRLAKPAANKVFGTDAGGALGYKDDPASGGAVAPFNATHPDAHPASPHTMDDEFDVGSSIDTAGTRRTGAGAWTWASQPTGTTAPQEASQLNFAYSGAGIGSLGALVQGISGTFKIRCKVALHAIATNYFHAGLCVRDSASGKLICFFFVTESTPAFRLYVSNYTNVTTISSTIFSTLIPSMDGYLEIEEDATNRHFRYSLTGHNGSFFTLLTQTKTTHLTTNQCGLAIRSLGTSMLAVYDWFRRIS